LATLELKNIRKEFDLDTAPCKFLLFEDISFRFEENQEFLSILSPFGAGKSTLLKIIAAIEPKTDGEILLDGKNYLSPNGRIILIPEKSSSFPWLTVEENIKVVSKKTRNDEIIKLIGLEGYENHYPDDNSRGFRFRIAIGRAVSLNPAFILIDDSMKKIDNATKVELYEMLREIARNTKIKFLMATTDISDAVRLSDRILVMKQKPSKIIKEFAVTRKDKGGLLEIISEIEDIFQTSDSNRSINFTI
jgi:NitT/TauT family transport system ATP-binding protein